MILNLAELETLVARGHDTHFSSRRRALRFLRQAVDLARSTVAEREEAYSHMVATCEKMQLPKGLSTPEKPYVHGRDRGRNLANRTPDMRYLVIDEELLDLKGWSDSLEARINHYEGLLER